MSARRLTRRQPDLVVLDRLEVLQEQGRRGVHLVGLQAPLHHPVDHQRQETDQPMMLSELRKNRVNMILSHQYLSQLDPQVRDAILGNTATIISFRLRLTDAEILAGEFYPFFSARDLINLPNLVVYLRLMIDGVVSQGFSAETLDARGCVSAPW